MRLLRKLSPDHKTIANFRHENGAALKKVFLDFAGLCVKLGLYGKELAAIDGSTFKAVNSRERNFTLEKLKDRTARLEGHIEEYSALA
jgi:transposase